MADTPDTWIEPMPEKPHDHKGHSEERCVRCGWVMGDRPLNCTNNDMPHCFPSQQAEIERLRGEVAKLLDGMEMAWLLIANGQNWDATDEVAHAKWNEAKFRWRDEFWHPALERNGEARRG